MTAEVYQNGQLIHTLNKENKIRIQLGILAAITALDEEAGFVFNYGNNDTLYDPGDAIETDTGLYIKAT